MDPLPSSDRMTVIATPRPPTIVRPPVPLSLAALEALGCGGVHHVVGLIHAGTKRIEMCLACPPTHPPIASVVVGASERQEREGEFTSFHREKGCRRVVSFFFVRFR